MFVHLKVNVLVACLKEVYYGYFSECLIPMTYSTPANKMLA